jgi:hypothetical protein
MGTAMQHIAYSLAAGWCVTSMANALIPQVRGTTTLSCSAHTMDQGVCKLCWRWHAPDHVPTSNRHVMLAAVVCLLLTVEVHWGCADMALHDNR